MSLQETDTPDSAISAADGVVKPIRPSFHNLPKELTTGDDFCLWKRIEGKKKPIIALTGRPAHTDSPRDFTSFAIARQAFERKTYKDITGLGRRLNHSVDGIYAVDVDNCVEAGVLTEYAHNLVVTSRTYCEFSPSGNGIRIFGRAPLPPALQGRGSVKIWSKGKHPDYKALEVQLFISGQYVTITGDQIPGSSDSVVNNEEFLLDLLRSNSAKQKQFFFEPRPIRSVAQRNTRSQATNEHTAVNANAHRTNSQIAQMLRTSGVFRAYWSKTIPAERCNSEYQCGLVRHFHIRYQPGKAAIEFMLRRWCKLHCVRYQGHRLNSWMRHASGAFEKTGRMPYKEHEAQRQRKDRAAKKSQLQPTTQHTQQPTPVFISTQCNTPLVGYGDRTAQVVSLRAEGKSLNQIASQLGISKSTVATLLRRQA